MPGSIIIRTECALGLSAAVTGEPLLEELAVCSWMASHAPSIALTVPAATAAISPSGLSRQMMYSATPGVNLGS